MAYKEERVKERCLPFSPAPSSPYGSLTRAGTIAVPALCAVHCMVMLGVAVFLPAATGYVAWFDGPLLLLSILLSAAWIYTHAAMPGRSRYTGAVALGVLMGAWIAEALLGLAAAAVLFTLAALLFVRAFWQARCCEESGG
jgi:hypothetical protein